MNRIARRVLTLFVMLTVMSSAVTVMAEDVFSSRSLGYGSLEIPVDVAVNSGGIYVTDKGRGSVISMGEDGQIFVEIKEVEGIPIDPAGICIKNTDSIIYVADTANDRVLALTPKLEVIRVYDQEDMKTTSPIDVAVDDTNHLYILSSVDRIISVITTNNGHSYAMAEPGAEEGQLASPRGIDVWGDRVAVADLGAHKSKIFKYSYGEIENHGIPGTYPSSLSGAYDNAWDEMGNLYVVDRNNNDVVIFPKTGLESFSWGRYGKVGKSVDFFHSVIEPRDFSSSPGRLCRPQGIDVFGDCMYIADTGNGRIVSVALDDVWRVPRVPTEFFNSQKCEVPAMIVSPEVMNFGVVSGKLTKTVSMQFTSCPGVVGNAYILGDENITVEPSVFVGSHVNFKVTVNGTKGRNNTSAILIIKSINRTAKVPIRAGRGKSKGLVFTDGSDRFVTMNRDGGYARIEIAGQNGFSGDVRLETTLPVYRPAWAKPAKDVDEIKLTTVGMSIGKSLLTIGDGSEDTLLTMYESGRLRSGLYTFNVIATATDNPSITATHTITLSIQSKATGVTYGTVLYESFTAHWCNPCGFHREAQYRLMDEYGRRNIIPVAYHVMDEDDETGMTTDLNFSRFKQYDGTGVPLSVMNGRKLNISGKSLTVKYAADRIRGRKYSGTSFEYWKTRAEYSLAYRENPLCLKISATLEDSTGSLTLRIGKHDAYSRKTGNVYFLLVEDGIEYFSENGEMHHSCIVRDFLTPEECSKHYINVDLNKENQFSFGFRVPLLPNGFEINTENLSLVVFVEDPKSGKILGTHWYDLSAPIVCASEVFLSGDDTLTRGSLSKIGVNISGLGTCTRTFSIEVHCSHDYVNAELSKNVLTVMPGETQTALLYLSTTQTIPHADDVFIDIVKTDNIGEKTSKRFEILTN